MNIVDLALDPALKTVDSLGSPLADSPLVRPIKQLAKELSALVQAGHFQGIELDLTHAETSCFLLRVAPEAPEFYIELFGNEPFFDEMFEEDEENEAVMPLNVLMNWMNSDTEPTFWQTGFNPLDTASPDVDFTEVIALILSLPETLPRTAELPETELRSMPRRRNNSNLLRDCIERSLRC